jgi:uncharacterized SAM-binding protein YcdF (DUF218 family)
VKLLRLLIILIAVAAAAVAINRATIPAGNTSATHFDTLIVLGNPTTEKGNPSSGQRERVLEAVREYKAGVAPAIIMTGGAAHTRFIEAETMAALAERNGVPASAIVKEPQALNTIQNLYYSEQIMRQHGWTSAEIISSPDHLPRAALIVQALARSQPAIQWHTHASLWPPEYSLAQRALNTSVEATRCLQLRIFGFPHSTFLP